MKNNKIYCKIKIAIYCPQGSGTLRQQLIMMHGIAWCFMVLRILYVFTKVNLWVTFTRDLNAIHNYRYQEKAVQCYRNQHWKPVSYHTVGQEGKEGKEVEAHPVTSPTMVTSTTMGRGICFLQLCNKTKY